MKIFISYAHVDKFLVKTQIVDILTNAGHDVWFDEKLIPGQNWENQLAHAIQSSDAFVYAMTPESVISDWCLWELAFAAEQNIQIVPVLLQSRTQIPDKLSDLQYVDFSDGATGEKVARLLGGLQYISRSQIPAHNVNPIGNPPQAIPSTLETPKVKVKMGLRLILLVIIISVTSILVLLAYPEIDRNTDTAVILTDVLASTETIITSEPTLDLVNTNLAITVTSSPNPDVGSLVLLGYTSTTDVTLYSQPSDRSEEFTSPSNSLAMIISEGVLQGNDKKWFEVQIMPDDNVGWVSREDILILPSNPARDAVFDNLCPGAIGLHFVNDQRFIVPYGDGPVTIWSEPNSHPINGYVNEGGEGTIVAGPVCDEGQSGNLLSWYIVSDDGIEGWVSEGYSMNFPWIVPLPNSLNN